VATYGFVIDLRKCIGCHACTIACKSEHDIPVGVNRCWVKTVEKGRFPDTQRLFLPVLCNQCTEAPCMNICPTGALFRRRDGIVDLNGGSCIGCRACMAACPYDQLFIDPNTQTAEKCNFCANRIENQLQPACVSVCPTECRIFGDMDDPTSKVAQIVQGDLAKIGVTANIALKDPTTLVNDGIAGNFESNVYACSVGVPEVQDFEDCSVYRPNKGPFSGPKTFPEYKESYYKASAIFDPAERIAAFKKVFQVLHDTAWAVPICMRGLLCGQSPKISGVVYDAKTHLVYQDIAKA